MQIAEESSLELEQVMTMRLKEQHFYVQLLCYVYDDPIQNVTTALFLLFIVTTIPLAPVLTVSSSQQQTEAGICPASRYHGTALCSNYAHFLLLRLNVSIEMLSIWTVMILCNLFENVICYICHHQAPLFADFKTKYYCQQQPTCRNVENFASQEATGLLQCQGLE